MKFPSHLYCDGALLVEWVPGLNMLNTPDSKVHGANMGPIWGRQDPDGPHVVPMNLVIWDSGM